MASSLNQRGQPRLPPRQPYPREPGSDLAAQSLFPKLNPPLTMTEIDEAIMIAFQTTKKNKAGDKRHSIDTAEKLVEVCLKHLRERSDPVIGPLLYSTASAEELFTMDAIPHEVHRMRMDVGWFYQYLIIEFMRKATRSANRESHIIGVGDGEGSADAKADVAAPNFDKGLKLYISVKKASDTVGGQDFPPAVRELEKIAVGDVNLRSPYLCVHAIATPNKGRIHAYEKERKIRKDKKTGHPHSYNSEIWMPGFLYPYITGRSAIEILNRIAHFATPENFFPFYSLKLKKEGGDLLHKELVRMGIVKEDGNVILAKLLAYVEKQEKKQEDNTREVSSNEG